LGRDSTGKIVNPGDVTAQTEQCIENIRLIIEAAGGQLSDLTKLTVFITHPRYYEAMNAVRSRLLANISFVSTTVVAQLIDPNGVIEIDAVATVD
jgi:aminoacrylate peracid reductase/2-iminobutanoate/2-iminopropanoate deaminase